MPGYTVDMSEQTNRESGLGGLFDLSRDAVLGVRGSAVVFANPAAKELFGSDAVGRRGRELLPDFLFDTGLDSFVSVARVAGRAYTISAVRQEGLLLLTLPREEAEAPAIPAAVLSQLRTTAYNLRMASELILARTAGDDSLSEYISILYHNYYAMLRLTNNLSDFAALSDGDLPCRLRTLDLAQLCRELTDSVSFFLRGGAELSFRCGPGSFLAQADREQIERLLLNLLANSFQHTAAGDRITLDLSRQGSQLILAVDDTGSGIPAGQLGYLFAVRGSREAAALLAGAGMGLYISQGIVRRHGGAIMLQSTEGQGTRVRVMLPACDAPALRDAQPPEARGPGVILTELAPVLGHDVYRKEYMD